MLKKFLVYFQKPEESPNASQRLIYLLWIMRVFTFLFGVYQIFTGDTIIGLAILLCCFILVTPAIITRNYLTDFPLEIEFMFFIMVFFQYVIGEAGHFYITVEYYDKFVHLLLPAFLGFMGFLVVYTLHVTKRLNVTPRSMIIAVILVTMGIGAIWEIIEYSNDIFLYPHLPGWHKFQGSIAETPYYDTMNDLVLDFLGGILGSLIAYKYSWKKDKKNTRIKELISEISNQFSWRKKPAKTEDSA